MARRKGRSIGDVSRYTATSSRPPSFDGRNDDDDTVTSGVTFFLVAMVAFLVLCFLAVRSGTAAIENDLETRATAALRSAEFPEVEVKASGTSVELTGSYTTDQNPDEAFAAVEALGGIGEVKGQIWPVSTDELEEQQQWGTPFEAEWAEGTLHIRGNLSTEEKIEFVSFTLDPDGDGVVTMTDPESTNVDLTLDVSALAMKEGIPDEEWLGDTLAMIRSAIDLLPAGLVRVDAKNEYTAVSGEVLERSISEELNAEIEALGVAHGFDATPGVLYIKTGPTEEEVEELQEELNELILDQVVEFEIQSFELTANGRALLDEVLAALEAAPEVRVLIEGHTDDRGTLEANQKLSEDRANAVLTYLVANGADPERFDTIGYGESRPVESNATEQGRARNRRIEFTALLDNVQEEEG